MHKQIIFDTMDEKIDEPTAATTHPVTKSSDGDYAQVK
jgi:hypothetical protein